MASFAQNIRKSQPMVFLSLAPTTSETPAASQPTAQQSVDRPATRRSSSLSSTSSVQYRFLKLGPVQNGAHLDESKEDFHEAAVVE